MSASIYQLLDSRKTCYYAKDSVFVHGFCFSCTGCFIDLLHLLQPCIVDFGYLRMSSESADMPCVKAK